MDKLDSGIRSCFALDKHWLLRWNLVIGLSYCMLWEVLPLALNRRLAIGRQKLRISERSTWPVHSITRATSAVTSMLEQTSIIFRARMRKAVLWHKRH